MTISAHRSISLPLQKSTKLFHKIFPLTEIYTSIMKINFQGKFQDLYSCSYFKIKKLQKIKVIILFSVG